MERVELIGIRSHEVQDIIGRSPSWILRWGITLIFLVFVALLGITWFIKYPDIIQANAIVTTNPSPISLVSRTAGKITLLKSDNQNVQTGEIVAYIQSNTNIDVIRGLEVLFLNYRANDDVHELYNGLVSSKNAGVLQASLNNTIKAIQSYSSYTDIHLFQKQIVHLEIQIKSYARLNRILTDQYGLVKQETNLTMIQYRTDSLLLSQNAIAVLDFNRSWTAMLQQLRAQKSLEATIISNQLQLDGLKKQVMELEIQKITQENELKANVSATISEVTAQLSTWKENYMFVSPIEGQLAHLGFLENDQFVEQKPLFAILPKSNTLVAKGELPLAGAGKVKVGQEVNIHLNNYPYEQFGVIRGVIESISSVPNNENYALIIQLPDGIKSSYQKELAFQPELKGEMEIITEDLRLLERFFYQFRVLFR